MLVPTIGIEVHVELKSKQKVYSTSPNIYSNEPNTAVELIDIAYPGTLPKLNKEVIDKALLAALALNCKINKEMYFDRKNYFYPDLPKGYQITQQDTPIGHDGYIDIEVNNEIRRIGIERIHIEEDTCKSIHGLTSTLLNFNRSGVPLIEIVTKPDIKTKEEAVKYVEALREILLYLDISDVKIEEGSMRCDTNISLKEENSNVFGTRVEVKNIGSITSVGLALDYEINRQKEIIESGNKVIAETRRYDDKNNITISMRVKETGNDYRYFPEPDLSKVILSDEEIEKVKNNIPILPNQLRSIYYKNNISDNVINNLIANKEIALYLNDITDSVNIVIAANLLTSDILAYMNKNKVTFNELNINETYFIELIKLLDNNTISSKQLKELLPHFLEKMIDPKKLIKELNLVQISDENSLLAIINNVLDNNEASIIDYRNKLDKALKYLMGQVMKESKGQANPIIANDLLIKELDNRINE